MCEVNDEKKRNSHNLGDEEKPSVIDSLEEIFLKIMRSANLNIHYAVFLTEKENRLERIISLIENVQESVDELLVPDPQLKGRVFVGSTLIKVEGLVASYKSAASNLCSFLQDRRIQNFDEFDEKKEFKIGRGGPSHPGITFYLYVGLKQLTGKRGVKGSRKSKDELIELIKPGGRLESKYLKLFDSYTPIPFSNFNLPQKTHDEQKYWERNNSSGREEAAKKYFEKVLIEMKIPDEKKPNFSEIVQGVQEKLHHSFWGEDLVKHVIAEHVKSQK